MVGWGQGLSNALLYFLNLHFCVLYLYLSLYEWPSAGEGCGRGLSTALLLTADRATSALDQAANELLQLGA